MSAFGKKSIAITITFLFLSYYGANSATISGSRCYKVGSSKLVSGIKYSCVKNSNNLVWKKIVSTPSKIVKTVNSQDKISSRSPKGSTAIGAGNIPYENPTSSSSNIENCKIVESSNSRGMTGAGFPRLTPLTKNTGTVKWALVPIDFVDVPGEPNPVSRVKDQMLKLTEWYKTVSEGKLNIEWSIHDKWITLPGKSSDYLIPYSDSPDRSPEIAEFWRKAITSTDPFVDYSEIQTVNFILPLKQEVVKETLQGFPWDQAVKSISTNEGSISSFTIPGVFMTQPKREYWSYWAHEFGHAITLPHIGSSRASSPFQVFDLMGTQDGPSRELSGWLRFLAGWMPEDRIFCKPQSELSNTEITLVPLSNSDLGIKLVIVPISSTKTLIIESRRITKFSCISPTNRNGVLAYIYDSMLGHGEEFLIPLSPKKRPLETGSCLTQKSMDMHIHQGEHVKYEGINIEVLRQANFDRIRLIKTN